MADYRMLKSGTDIRGRAIADADNPAVLTEEAVAAFAAAFCKWLTVKTGKPHCRIAIARDSRVTGEKFVKTIISALRAYGQELFDCGLFSTPAAYMMTKFPSTQADGAIMVTASHHPMHINGLKFFTAEGGVNSQQLDEIIELAESGATPNAGAYSTVTRRDFLRLYCDALTEVIRKGTGLFMPLRGMKIVVDAGHGAGGFFANRVLAPLGADISGSQFLEPDGTFPAHSPNPENAQAMESVKNRTLQVGADLGIIFDADVDRCAIVSAEGEEINRCRLIALAAAILLPDHPGATIVTDSVTTEGLRTFIQQKGGVQCRFKRGYRNVIDEAKRLNALGIDAPLAIESSGHAAFSDHYFLDDGAYFIARILVTVAKLKKQGKTLSNLIVDYVPPKEEADIRLNFTCKDFKERADLIITRLNGFSERMFELSDDNNEGVRAYIKSNNGYFIVRSSVHDPVLPIYIESDKTGGVVRIARMLYEFLRGFDGLNCTPLSDYIAANATSNDKTE